MNGHETTIPTLSDKNICFLKTSSNNWIIMTSDTFCAKKRIGRFGHHWRGQLETKWALRSVRFWFFLARAHMGQEQNTSASLNALVVRSVIVASAKLNGYKTVIHADLIPPGSLCFIPIWIPQMQTAAERTIIKVFVGQRNIVNRAW